MAFSMCTLCTFNRHVGKLYSTDLFTLLLVIYHGEIMGGDQVEVVIKTLNGTSYRNGREGGTTLLHSLVPEYRTFLLPIFALDFLYKKIRFAKEGLEEWRPRGWV